MAATKLTCPDCGKVLRPAKPLAAGKRVKCPACGGIFTALDDAVDAVAPAPVKAASKAKAPAAKKPKKTGDDKPAKKKTSKPSFDDEDDGPLTYGFSDRPDEGREGQPEIDHAPDTSTKDLRGPAQAVVVRPSNWLIYYGVLGFLSYLAFAVIILIPILFPVPPPVNADGTADLAPRQKQTVTKAAVWVGGSESRPALERLTKDDKAQGSMFMISSWDLMEAAALGVLVVLLIIFPCFLGMIYCAVVAYGGVKMQTLESRTWGFVAGVMVMLPVQTLAFFALLSIVFSLICSAMLDENDPFWIFTIPTLVGFGGNLFVGLWVLRTLNREDVVAGYEYVSDT